MLKKYVSRMMKNLDSTEGGNFLDKLSSYKLLNRSLLREVNKLIPF
jgi:hypothetical protein